MNDQLQCADHERVSEIKLFCKLVDSLFDFFRKSGFLEFTFQGVSGVQLVDWMVHVEREFMFAHDDFFLSEVLKP